MTTYTTRTEAIQSEIIDPINSGEADARDYDIENIALQVLGGYEEGYALEVTPDEFWQIVEDEALAFSVEVTTYSDDNELAIGWKIVSSIDETIAQGDFGEPVVFNEDTGADFDEMTEIVARAAGLALENVDGGAQWNDASSTMSWPVTITWER